MDFQDTGAKFSTHAGSRDIIAGTDGQDVAECWSAKYNIPEKKLTLLITPALILTFTTELEGTRIHKDA